MQSYRLTLLIIQLASLALLGAKSSEQKSFSDRQSQDSDLKPIRTTSSQHSDTLQQQNLTLRGPFIVLMSSETISVAQLPMIENGNLTDVYHLDLGAQTSKFDDDATAVFEEEEDYEDPGKSEAEREETQTDDGEGKTFAKSNNRDSGTDAREYEQQMPRPALVNVIKNNTSLGNSEWQQIAPPAAWPSSSSAVRDREEVWPSPLPQMQTGSRKEDQPSGGVSGHEPRGEERTRPRRRRRVRRSSGSASGGDHDRTASGDSASNSLAADDDAREHGPNNSNSSQRQENSADDASAQANRVNRAEESSSSSGAQNVTSAAWSATGAGYSAQQPRQPDFRGGSEHGGQASEEVGDKNRRSTHNSDPAAATDATESAPATRLSAATAAARVFANSAPAGVQFCDFDVHMALAYAFVADSTGRIHRFKLPSGSASSGLGRTRTATEGHRKATSDGTTADGNNNGGAGENDYMNTIDVQKKFESAELNTRTAAANETTQASTAAALSNSIRLDENDNNHLAHEVGNDESRTRSGARSSNANKVGAGAREQSTLSSERQHPTSSGSDDAEELRLTPASAGAPTSGVATPSAQQPANQAEMVPIDGSGPRIIWSRSKFSAPLLSVARRPNRGAAATTATARTKSTAAQLQHHTQRDAHEGASPAFVDAPLNSNQVVGGDQRIGSQASTAVHSESVSATAASLGTAANKRQRRVRQLKTKIAVDWMSNLLFVLDKYRLLVVDFNGNNELVLIDDFNAITRPIEMKVDPVNNFLFWLQAGRFYNTIYKLDLSVLSMPSATQRLVGNMLKLRLSSGRTMAASLQESNANDSENVTTGLNSVGNYDSSDLVALVSHHYAHPIITNLPRHARIFTIDHKHSRIYVPLSSTPASESPVSTEAPSVDAPSKRNEDAEVFAPNADTATHLNNTDGVEQPPIAFDNNCTVPATKTNGYGQILAYNLDGTDVGPLRTVGENSHITSLDDIQDLTLDTKSNLLYWLTNDGREIFEEYKDGTTIHPAQHDLDGKSYAKLIHYDAYNQPNSQKPRYNMRKVIQTLASSLSPNRLTRSDVYEDGHFEDSIRASSLNVRQRMGSDGAGMGATRFSRNAPYIILAITCLIVITVYLIYTLIFQQMNGPQQHHHQGDIDSHMNRSSMDSSSIGESAGSDNDRARDADHGFLSTASAARCWPAPGPSMRSSDTFNRDLNSMSGGRVGAYDLESSNYDASNAIDEHYRNDSIANQSSYCDEIPAPADLKLSKLVDIGAWPTRMHEVFNKLYVPVELLQDEGLATIRRISMDQIEIERKNLLGEGHFGTVLQGKIKCSEVEKTNLVSGSSVVSGVACGDQSQRLRLPSSAPLSTGSSGHGSSSSTSGEFITANSCTVTNDDDYLTPRNQLDSAASDYLMNEMAETELAQGSENYCETNLPKDDTLKSKTTTIKVAIKKLKENASLEEKRDFLHEAKLLANFEHPNIVQLVGICLDRGSTLIVMELMLGGDLIRYMQEHTPNSRANNDEELTYDDLLKICLDIVNGCCYLEVLDYIHRDLAARNCLVSSRKRSERVVKLADFGLARDIYKDSYYKKLNDSAMPLKWMAPECLIEQRFTKKSDVWSFGVVMWEVMGYCQEKPYSAVEPFFMKEHLASGARLKKPSSCDEDMYRLMLQCWQMDPDRRPTFNECRAILIEIRNSKIAL